MAEGKIKRAEFASKKRKVKSRTISQAAAAEKNPNPKANFGMAKRLSDASKRDRTPGQPKGSKQDRLQKRLFAKAAAREAVTTARNNAAKKRKK